MHINAPVTVTGVALILVPLALALPGTVLAEPPDGKALYEKWCAICHSPGPMKAGMIALQAKYQNAKPADLEQRTDLSVEFIKALARRGSGIMAPFRKTELSDSDLDAIGHHLTRAR